MLADENRRRETLPPFGATEHEPLGRRLVPKLIDERAEREPTKIFSSIPISDDLTDGYHDITYATLARAIDRAAWWLHDATGQSPKGCKFASLGPNDLRYVIFVVAAMKCRYQILLLSPRNTDEYQRQLFRQVECTSVICATSLLPKMQATLGDSAADYSAAPELEQLLHGDGVLRYPYEVKFEEVKEEVCVILHTSGSTGPPKPIDVSTEGALAIDMQGRLEDPENRLWWRALTVKRLYMGFPGFHAAALLSCLLLPVFFDYITVYGPPGPPTADAVEAIHRHAKLSGGFYPSFLLDEIAQTPSALETMENIDIAVYGGGPLAQVTGERLMKLTHLHSVFGHTEGLVPPHFITDDEDWAYFHFHPGAGCMPEHLRDDLYEMVMRRNPENEYTQAVFKVFSDLDRYSTGDMLSPHPTKPGLWLYRGRVDDLVVLSTREKFNPLSAEAIINESRLVTASLVIGEGRPRPVLLVQRDDDATTNMTDSEITEDLWPLIEKANDELKPQARLIKDRVVVLPAGETFAVSSKGNMQRKVSARKLWSYIDGLSSFAE